MCSVATGALSWQGVACGNNCITPTRSTQHTLALGSIASIGEKVRREKALDFSGWNSRPGTGSLHPVAIEAAVEATKLSELSMERVARRLRERAGHNVSKR